MVVVFDCQGRSLTSTQNVVFPFQTRMIPVERYEWIISGLYFEQFCSNGETPLLLNNINISTYLPTRLQNRFVDFSHCTGGAVTASTRHSTSSKPNHGKCSSSFRLKPVLPVVEWFEKVYVTRASNSLTNELAINHNIATNNNIASVSITEIITHVAFASDSVVDRQTAELLPDG